MKILKQSEVTEIPIANNDAIEKILVGADGTVAILYKGSAARVHLRTNDKTSPMIEVGPSLQIRLEHIRKP